MSDAYFVIHNGDGDTTVEVISREELLARLDEHEFGKNPIFLQGVQDMDTNYWGDGYLIIKGQIITPKAKQVIEKYEVD